MGLSTKQVSGDHHHHGIIDWDPQTSLQTSSSTSLDLTRPHPSVQQQQEEKPESLNCPRCGSTNTKFCYYNNYNKSQPRHFCKGCKRHWTEGGTLRNIPVGGSRKNKRLKTQSAATVSAAAATTSTPTAGDQKPIFHHASGGQKNMSSIFFPSLQNDPIIGNNSTTFNIGPASMVPHGDQDMKLVPFSFSSSLGYFDPISCSIPTFNNHSSSNSAYRDIIGELDNVEESTITTVMPFTSSSIISQPWQDQAIMSSSAMDMANYWSLSDIDSLVSADLNIPWDDLEMKPKGK